MAKDFKNTVERISEVVMFENWLRFYFIDEDGDKLVLRLPEKAMQRIRESYSTFYELADRLNNTEIDHKNSLNAVCLFVAAEIDGSLAPESVISRVFDSLDFQMELQLFSTFVQTHEDELDESFMEFNSWLSLFEEWKTKPEVKDFIKELSETLPLSVREAPATEQ